MALYSQPPVRLSAQAAISLAFVLVFLIVFRLYDDLLQAPSDLGKPERSYTEPETGRTLTVCLFVLFAALLGFAYFLSPLAALVLFFFIGANHLLYRLFVRREAIAGFLPLLKYPVLYGLLQMAGPSAPGGNGAVLLFSAALFPAFVAFESLDDETFVVPRKYAGALQALAFAMVLSGGLTRTAAMAGTVLVLLSLGWLFLRMRGSQYLFFVCLLILRLAVFYSYEL